MPILTPENLMERDYDFKTYMSRRDTTFFEHLGASFEEGIDVVQTLNFLKEANIQLQDDPPATTFETAGDFFNTLIAPPANAMSKEEWEASPFFREEIPFTDNMTPPRAEAYSEDFDLRRFREKIYDRSPGGLRSVVGFGVMLAAQALDPINYIPILGPVARARLVLKLGQTGGRMAAGALEATVGAALTEPFLISSLRAQGEDIGFTEGVIDVLFSTAIGSIFGASGALLHKRRVVRARKAAGQGVRDAMGRDLEKALSDTDLGEPVDVRGLDAKKTDQLRRSVGDSEALPGEINLRQGISEDELLEFRQAMKDAGMDVPSLKEKVKAELADIRLKGKTTFDSRVTKNELVIKEAGKQTTEKGTATKAMKLEMLEALSEGKTIRVEKSEGRETYWHGFMGFEKDGIDSILTPEQFNKIKSGKLAVNGWPEFMADQEFARLFDRYRVPVDEAHQRVSTLEPTQDLKAQDIIDAIEADTSKGLDIIQSQDLEIPELKKLLAWANKIDDPNLRSSLGKEILTALNYKRRGGIGPTKRNIDFKTEPIEDPPDLSEVEAHLGETDNAGGLSDDLGIDPETGRFLELEEVENLEKAGKLTKDETDLLAMADESIEKVTKYEKAFKVASDCVIRT